MPLAQKVIDYFSEHFRNRNLKKAFWMPRKIMSCSYILTTRVIALKILNELVICEFLIISLILKYHRVKGSQDS